MELHCEGITPTNKDEKTNELNPSATEFYPKQNAAGITKWRLKDIAVEDDDGDIDNAYQIGGVHVANVNIVICEM